MRSVLDKESLQVLDEHNALEEEETTEDIGSETHSEGQIKVHTQSCKKRSSSHVWEHYTYLGKDENGVGLAACNYCEVQYKCGYGTTNMIRHQLRCTKKPISNNIRKSEQIDDTVVREMTAKIIVYHDLPFSFVEYKMVRELLKYLNDDYKFISRKTVAADV